MTSVRLIQEGVTMKLAHPSSITGDTEESPGGEATPIFQRGGINVVLGAQTHVVPDQDEAAPQESEMQ